MATSAVRALWIPLTFSAKRLKSRNIAILLNRGPTRSCQVHCRDSVTFKKREGSDPLGSASRPPPLLPKADGGRVKVAKGWVPVAWFSFYRASYSAPAELPQNRHAPSGTWSRSGDIAIQVGARQDHCLRGPLSTCCQSTGMPFSEISPPPPHLNPWPIARRPQVTLWKSEGSSPRETSMPVAGQLRWVLRLSGAVGRP